MFYLQDSSGLAATVAPKHGSPSSRATLLFFKVLFNIAMFKKEHSSKGLVFNRTNFKNNCFFKDSTEAKQDNGLTGQRGSEEVFDRSQQQVIRKYQYRLLRRKPKNRLVSYVLRVLNHWDLCNMNTIISDQAGELCREGEEAARGCGRDRQHSSHFWDVRIHFPNSCFFFYRGGDDLSPNTFQKVRTLPVSSIFAWFKVIERYSTKTSC